MKPGAHLVLAASLRLYMPLLGLFALSLLALWPAGSGVGFVAGLVLSLVFALHVLTFGAEAASAAFPPILARLMLGLGVVLVMAAVGIPGWSFSPRAIEAGVCLATLGGSALILIVLCARAPTLRDEDW